MYFQHLLYNTEILCVCVCLSTGSSPWTAWHRVAWRKTLPPQHVEQHSLILSGRRTSSQMVEVFWSPLLFVSAPDSRQETKWYQQNDSSSTQCNVLPILRLVKLIFQFLEGATTKWNVPNVEIVICVHFHDFSDVAVTLQCFEALQWHSWAASHKLQQPRPVFFIVLINGTPEPTHHTRFDWAMF